MVCSDQIFRKKKLLLPLRLVRSVIEIRSPKWKISPKSQTVQWLLCSVAKSDDAISLSLHGPREFNCAPLQTVEVISDTYHQGTPVHAATSSLPGFPTVPWWRDVVKCCCNCMPLIVCHRIIPALSTGLVQVSRTVDHIWFWGTDTWFKSVHGGGSQQHHRTTNYMPETLLDQSNARNTR